MLGKATTRLLLLSAVALTTVACSATSSNYYAREKSDRSSYDHQRPIGASVSYYDGYNEYYDPHRFHRPKPKKFERDGYTRYDHQRLLDHDPRERDRDEGDSGS